MNLEVNVSVDVSYNDIIINALSMVAGKNDCSVILSKSEMTYIQTDGVTLEHQEGSLDYHYYCPDSLSLDHMVEAFQSYARFHSTA